MAKHTYTSMKLYIERKGELFLRKISDILHLFTVHYSFFLQLVIFILL